MPLPRLPRELIRAMLRAAFAGEMTSLAMAQIGAVMEEEAARAMLKPARFQPVLFENPAITRARAPEKAEMAMCQRRSERRSELAPTRTMARTATRFGMADRNPIARFGKPERWRRTLGSQRLTP